MNWPSRIYRATLGRRRRLYDDLSEEIRQHLEEKTEQFQREGMGREEAMAGYTALVEKLRSA